MPIDTSALHNSYLGQRHGPSIPQAEGIILSNPEQGRKPENGLIETGRQHVCDGLWKCINTGILQNRNIVVWHSPFSRAKETAEVDREILGVPLVEHADLRERDFGALENGPNTRYDEIWQLDRQNPQHTEHGVESAEATLERMASVIALCEGMYRNVAVILASHGDSLQILETGFRHLPVSRHRDLEPLLNSEVRLLWDASASRAS